VLGRLHILFNLSTVVPIYAYLSLNKYDYNALLGSCIIILLFSNFPDIDISNNRRMISKIIRNIFYFFFVIFALLLKKRKAIRHRGITHSLQGLILFSTSIFTIWLILIEMPININWLYNVIIPLSAIAAYSLHLLGDAVTKEGVDLVMNGRKIKGIIKVGKTDYIYASLYSFVQISSMLYLSFNDEIMRIPWIAFLTLTFFTLIPILLNYTNNDSR